MKLAVAVGLFGLGCCLSLHDSVIEARRLGVQETARVHAQPATPAERNRNPLNVKGVNWVGQVGSDEQGHAIFAAPEYGIRAAAKVLRSYYQRHGINTLRGIVMRFAEGNQREYIVFLCKRMGLGPDETFSVMRRMPELLRHMSRFECGQTLPDRFFAPYDILS